ncbi:MAG: hypothetical protein WAM60_12615 [Candidatus Promineifilaceae bacterium]
MNTEFTHRQALKNLALVLIITSLALCLSLSVLVSASVSLSGFAYGVITGIVAGALACWYLSTVWDPVTLKSRDGCSTHAYSGCWLPIVTVTSVIAGRIFSSFFDASFFGWFSGFGMTMMYMIIGYMMVQVWRHRLR